MFLEQPWQNWVQWLSCILHYPDFKSLTGRLCYCTSIPMLIIVYLRLAILDVIWKYEQIFLNPFNRRKTIEDKQNIQEISLYKCLKDCNCQHLV